MHDPAWLRRCMLRSSGQAGASPAGRLQAMPDTTDARRRERVHANGTIAAVRGSVVDARFAPPLPPLNSRLLAGEGKQVVIEVASHVDAATVRGVALTPTRGLA